MLHVIPVGDRVLHRTDSSCECRPFRDSEHPDEILHHRAIDNRVTREKYEGKCSDGWIIIDSETGEVI